MSTIPQEYQTTIEVTICHCRCGYTWQPRLSERPRVCPKCHSPRWDAPYRRARKSTPKET